MIRYYYTSSPNSAIRLAIDAPALKMLILDVQWKHNIHRVIDIMLSRKHDICHVTIVLADNGRKDKPHGQ